MNSDDAWNTHEWYSPNGRRIEIEPGKSVIHHQCSRCRRDFVHDPASEERYPVHVSIFELQRLPDSIATRWLAEPCPGAPALLEGEIRSRLIDRSAE